MIRPAASHSMERGFSLIEALIVLTITSLILAAIMPISIRSISSNLAIGERSLSDAARAIDETAFRSALASAVPARQTLSTQPGRITLTGDASRIELISLSSLGAACGEPHRETTISLLIERDAAGGRLVCAGPSARRVLATWSVGDAAFSYSRDGTVWGPVWPLPEDARAWERGLADFDNPGAAAPLVWAPLVRFEIAAAGPSRMVWIERAGDVAPVEFDPEAIFTGELFGGGL